MANNLDQFFQKKLRNRYFTPKAGDWAAMENLMNSGSVPPPSSSLSINWIYSGLFVALTGIAIYVGFGRDISSENGLKSEQTKIEKIDAQSNLSMEVDKGISSNKNSVEKQGINDLQNSSNDLQNNSLTKKGENRESISYKDDELNISNNSGENSNSNTFEKGENSNSNTISKNDNTSENILITQNLSSEAKNLSPAKKTEATNSKNGKNDIDTGEENLKVNSAPSSKSASNGDEEELFYERNKAEQNKNSDTQLTEFTSSYKADPKIIEGYFNASKSNYSHLFLSSAPVKTFEDHQIQQSIISPVFDDPQKIKALKVKRSLPIQLSVAALAEVSYITKNIKGDSEYLSLISIRNSQEKNKASGSLGLEFQATYKNIGLSSGIILGQYGENIQYEEKYAYEWEVSSTEIGDTLWNEDIIFTYDSIVNPLDSSSYLIFVVDSSFVTVVDSIIFNTVYDSSLVDTELGLAKQNGRTTIQYWEIPLYFSYKFDIGDFYLSPGIGVTIGFLKITKGYYMDEDLMSLIPINTSYAVFKKTLVNGLINFGVGYRLGDRFSIEATPSYRFNLTNILENPGMIQKYSAISLQFRLRYYF